MAAPIHIPVLADEVLRLLEPRRGQLLVDGTLGGGGHARLLAERVGPDGLVIGLDRDPSCVESAQRNLSGLLIDPMCADFADLPEILAKMGREVVDGVLLDLGLSSDQLADDDRGFSFESEGPLDLRYNPTVGEPAWRLLERISADRLADLIYQYSQERYSRRIARQIVETRRRHPLRSAAQLAALVRRCVPRSRGHRIDPATRTFQALRIAVNDELGSLERALQRVPDCLRVGGRVAIISFHSLEDRRVKVAFRDDRRLERLTKRPVRPTQAEVVRNPRSRSARLRAARRAGP